MTDSSGGLPKTTLLAKGTRTAASAGDKAWPVNESPHAASVGSVGAEESSARPASIAHSGRKTACPELNGETSSCSDQSDAEPYIEEPEAGPAVKEAQAESGSAESNKKAEYYKSRRASCETEGDTEIMPEIKEWRTTTSRDASRNGTSAVGDGTHPDVGSVLPEAAKDIIGQDQGEGGAETAAALTASASTVLHIKCRDQNQRDGSAAASPLPSSRTTSTATIVELPTVKSGVEELRGNTAGETKILDITAARSSEEVATRGGKRTTPVEEVEPTYRVEEIPRQDATAGTGARGGTPSSVNVGSGQNDGANLRRLVVVIDLPAMVPGAGRGGGSQHSGGGRHGAEGEGLRKTASGADGTACFELDVAPCTLDLRVPGLYKLSLDLPFAVDADLVTAKFSRKRAALTVSAPERE